MKMQRLKVALLKYKSTAFDCHEVRDFYDQNQSVV